MAPELHRLNDILLYSKRPKGGGRVMGVFGTTAGWIGIWQYPFRRTILKNLLCWLPGSKVQHIGQGRHDLLCDEIQVAEAHQSQSRQTSQPCAVHWTRGRLTSELGTRSDEAMKR